MHVQDLLAKFPHVKQSGSEWMVRCPAHEDSTASLSIRAGYNGTLLLYCHAGCATADIVDALGVSITDLFPPQPAQGIVATYDYRDLSGVLIHQAVRFAPKDFRVRMPDGAGGWIWKTSKKRLPYRWPDLQGHQTIYLVEGEKDADALWAIGLPATCNLGGAGKWQIRETQCLSEIGVTRVIILPDNDAPGAKHAQDVTARMKGAQIACSTIVLPDIGKHGDVSDWLAQGHTAAELTALATHQPYIVPKVAALPADVPIPAVLDLSCADYTLSDLGAAEAFRDREHGRLRYDHQRKHWLVWHDHYWQPDASAESERLAHAHIRTWEQEASALPAGHPKRINLMEFTLKLERLGAMQNFLTLTKALVPIATTGVEWDQDGWLLGVKNGVLDLKTGDLRAGCPADSITKQARVSYNPSATCPRWMQFLNEVFETNAALIQYVKKAVGYSLTGDMREQCFFMAVGTGSNGKSIFLDTLEHVFADYSHRAPMRMFASTDGEADKFSVAELQGSRIVFASETRANTRMNEHVIKALTGGETLSGERKYHHPFTFRPIAKIWLGVNNNPAVADDSFGFWRRVRLIPFTVTFDGQADDRQLRDILREEALGILAWAVEGCYEWQEEGLMAPDIVLQATKEYAAEEDPMTDFLSTCCKIDPEGVVLFSALYGEYKTWAKEQGIPIRSHLSSKAMAANLKKRGYAPTVGGARRYWGLTLLTPQQRDNRLFED